jgi:hypothetical protein
MPTDNEKDKSSQEVTPAPAENDAELSDADLENVAGGSDRTKTSPK